MARLIRVTTFNRHSYDLTITPRSAALSPDGKTLYLTGYGWWNGFHRPYEWLNGVLRCDPLDANDTPTLFAGSMDRTKDRRYTSGGGTKPGLFRAALSVACDSAGRVYVAEYMNDRVQVFSPDGTFLKAITIERPAVVQVHQRTGEIYVASWFVPNQFAYLDRPTRARNMQIKPTLTRLGAFGDERIIARYEMSLRTAPPARHHPDRMECDFTLARSGSSPARPHGGTSISPGRTAASWSSRCATIGWW